MSPVRPHSIIIDSFILTMTSSEEERPLRLLSLGKCLHFCFLVIASLTDNHRTDGGGIRGLSELLLLKEIMHRVMVDENADRKRDGRPLLTSLPKPCEIFDLIGGTSTGGCVTSDIWSHDRVVLILSFQNHRSNARASSDGFGQGDRKLR